LTLQIPLNLGKHRNDDPGYYEGKNKIRRMDLHSLFLAGIIKFKLSSCNNNNARP
jgi:hypothetical protein